MISISPHLPKTWIKCSNRNSWIFSSKPRCWSCIIFALQTFITSSSPCLTRILFTYIVHLYQMKMCLAYLCKVCHITLTYPQQRPLEVQNFQLTPQNVKESWADDMRRHMAPGAGFILIRRNLFRGNCQPWCMAAIPATSHSEYNFSHKIYTQHRIRLNVWKKPLEKRNFFDFDSAIKSARISI